MLLYIGLLFIIWRNNAISSHFCHGIFSVNYNLLCTIFDSTVHSNKKLWNGPYVSKVPARIGSEMCFGNSVFQFCCKRVRNARSRYHGSSPRVCWSWNKNEACFWNFWKLMNKVGQRVKVFWYILNYFVNDIVIDSKKLPLYNLNSVLL